MAHRPGNLPDWPPEADPLADSGQPLSTVGKGSAPSSARVAADSGTQAGQGSGAGDVGDLDFGFPFRDRQQADPAHLARIFGSEPAQQYSGYSPAHHQHAQAPTSPLSTRPGALPTQSPSHRSQHLAHSRQAQQMQFPPPDFTHPSFWLGQQGQGGSAVDGAAFGSPSAPSQGAGGAGSGGVSLSMLEMGNGASDGDELSGTGLGLQGSSFLPPHSSSHQMNVDPASMSWPGNLPTASAPPSQSDNNTYPPPSPTSTRGSKRPRHDHHNASASSLPGASSAYLPHPPHPHVYQSNTAAASGAVFSTHPALAQHELPLPPFDKSSDEPAHIPHPASNDAQEDAFALPTPGSSFSAPGASDPAQRRHFPRNSGSLRTGLYAGSTGSPSGTWSRSGSASTGSGGASRAGSGSAPGSGGASSASAEGSRKGSEHSQTSGSRSGSGSHASGSRSGSGSASGSGSGPTMLAQQVFPSPSMSTTNGTPSGAVAGTGTADLSAPGTGTIYEDLAGERLRTPSATSAQSEDEPMAGPSMVAGGIAVREPGKVVGDGKKIVQKADKSCKKCRERRVRCDRAWPTCSRCKKRRETCEWTEVTNVDDIEEGGDAERIAELQAKVASLERQLKAANVSIKSTSALPAPPVPSSQSQPSLEASPPESNKSGPASLGAGFESVQALVQELWSTRLQLKDAEGEVLIQFLARQTTAVLDLGRANVNWRLGEPILARSLTCHLLDAALHACCSKLPGIQPLAERIDEYKRNIDFLNPPQQCAVAVLCALGARASPHSQLLGIATVHLQDGTPSPPLYLYAGERREMACRQLEQRARELCWSHGFFNEPDLAQLDSMVGLVQLLIFELPSLLQDEEVLPKQSRFFCRAAIGAYFDIRHDALERGDRTSRDPRIGPGTALFLADASISSACGRPSYITTGELDQYIISDGVKIPDFPGSELGDELGKILQRPLTQDKLVSALSTTCLWVAGCQRLFATLSTGRRPGVESTLPLLKNLWKLIDKVHNAIQELQQLFVSLSPEEVEGMADDPFGLEHYVLMGVRYDSLLVDLVNLQHVYLMRNRNTPGVWNETEKDPLLHAMREESILRVRKCLKLAAFYAQLYLQSQDKHLVHHMLMQLEMLPEWSIWANQRITSPGGPTSEEYEVTDGELDWFQQALELASYYNPKAAHRLAEFSRSRSHFSQHPQRGVEELLRDAPHPNPMMALQQQQQPLIEQQLSQNPRFFYDLPPHDVASLQHMSPNDDPQRFYNVAAAEPFVPSPNQLYVFNNYGVAADQGRLLSDQPPVPSLDFVQGHFNGQNWMAMSPPIQERNSMQKEYEHAGQRLGGDSPEWMRNAGRSEEAS